MKIGQFLKQPWLKKILLISILITLVYVSLYTRVDFFQTLRLKGLDLAMRVKHSVEDPPGAVNDVVIIDIDDESVKKIGKRWPWDRRIFAELMDRLADHNPRVICFDILFIGKSADGKADETLARALKKGRPVLLASGFDASGKYTKPLKSIMDSASGIGFVDFLRDKDFVVRRTRPVMFSRKGRLIDFSLSLKAAAFYFGIPQKNIFYDGRSILLKKIDPGKEGEGYIIIPLVGGSELRMNYLVDKTQLLHIPLHRVMDKSYPAKIFDDKVVLIGVTSKSVPDVYPSPLGMMSGVLMNANCILMFLGGNFIKTIPAFLNIAILFLISFLACAVTYRISVIKREFYCLALLAAFLSLSLLPALRNYQWDLFGGVLIIVSGYIIASLYKYIGLVMENVALRLTAITDPLTGLYVHKYFDLKLRNEFKKAQRENGRLALLIVDIDHFKALNNKYGNSVGDAVLKALARLIKDNSRRQDMVARYGGEEIVLVLINTGLEGAYICAKKIHKAIAEFEFEAAPGKPLHVTASVGVATYPWKQVGSRAALIENADAALYRAKNTGRNKVCIFDREEIT